MRLNLRLLPMGIACLAGATPASAQNTQSSPAHQIVVTVGAGGQYRTISAAVAAADADPNMGNIYAIEVAPGTYINDFPRVTRPMTIELNPAFQGQQVVLQATENLPNEKGIILTTASLTVRGLVFTGAHIDESLGGNGAGIRDQNTGPAQLMVEDSEFVGNQEGILTQADPGETITIVNSRFLNNGNPDGSGQEHALYVGAAGTLTVSNSLFCGVLFGHDIKSRAAVTIIANNKLYDGQGDAALGCNAGSTSYAIDVPNGGAATITGNQILQGEAAQNHKTIAYGEEGLAYSNNSLLISGNEFTSTATWPTTAIYDPHCITANLAGDTFQGVGTIISPGSCAVFRQ